MPLTNEEIQLIEQAVKNEIYNLEKIAERAEDPVKAQDWVIKKRRLEIAMRELKSCAFSVNNYVNTNWRYDEV